MYFMLFTAVVWLLFPPSYFSFWIVLSFFCQIFGAQIYPFCLGGQKSRLNCGLKQPNITSLFWTSIFNFWSSSFCFSNSERASSFSCIFFSHSIICFLLIASMKNNQQLTIFVSLFSSVGLWLTPTPANSCKSSLFPPRSSHISHEAQQPPALPPKKMMRKFHWILEGRKLQELITAVLVWRLLAELFST